MNDVGLIATKTLFIPELNFKVTYNPQILLFSWVVILLIFGLGLFLIRAVKGAPSRRSALLETLYGSFSNMATEAMGADGRKFVPLVVTIFLFVLISNWLGVVPGLQSPTKDLNTCLALGFLVFVVAHTSAMRKKGLKSYLKGYFEPFFFFLPINIVGEFGKLVSHSGNIFAGAIIFALSGPVIIKTFNAIGLPTYSASPFILGALLISQAFFGLFVGTVQALVFALLALTYIAILREA